MADEIIDKAELVYSTYDPPGVPPVEKKPDKAEILELFQVVQDEFDTLSATVGALGAGGAPSVSSFAQAKRKVLQGAADVVIVIFADSTGDTTSESSYIFAEWLAGAYPSHTVEYYLNSGSGFGAATTIATGSGSRTIKVYNNAVSGARLEQWMATRYAAALGALTPDLVIINDGHNRIGLANSFSVYKALLQGVQQILLDKPGTPIAITVQNPRRDDSDYDDDVAPGIRDLAAQLPGITVIDVFARFLEANKDAGYYADNVHPNASGHSTLWLPEITRHWTAAQDEVPYATFQPWWQDREFINLVPNGDLSAYTAGVPDNFTAPSGGVSEETTIVPPGKSSSAKVVSSASEFLQFQATSGTNADFFAAVKGRSISLAIQLYAASGGAGSAPGRVIVQFDGTGAGASIDAQSLDASYGQDGWMWVVIPRVRIPKDATFVLIKAYGNAGGAGTTYYGEINAFLGADRPLDA